jgi:hypothetical protein
MFTAVKEYGVTMFFLDQSAGMEWTLEIQLNGFGRDYKPRLPNDARVYNFGVS